MTTATRTPLLLNILPSTIDLSCRRKGCASVEIPPASYTARVSRASESPIVVRVSGVNLNNRQLMASAVNLDGCLIQSTFLQPFHPPSLGEIASLFVVLSAGYIHWPPVSSIFVKDCSSVLAIPQHGTGVFTIWHSRPHMIPTLHIGVVEIKKLYCEVPSAVAVIKRRPNICASLLCTSIPKVVSPK